MFWVTGKQHSSMSSFGSLAPSTIAAQSRKQRPSSRNKPKALNPKPKP